MELISFIIPAYNEQTELPATLRSMQAAAREAECDYEVVVVDDGSTDDTAALARGLGARVISISRRQIAVPQNAGAHVARGEILIFVDADTHIASTHINGVLRAIERGYAGGGARIVIGGRVPRWGKTLLRLFSFLYFGLNLGAGAFLFTTRPNFFAAGGFDERYFAGEEIYFTLALRKLGRFILLRPPVVTSGRKLRLYPAGRIVRRLLAITFSGPGVIMSRQKLDLWYGGEREQASER
jgi:glycosyltransferase involved in cell wall biosynthesis